MQEFGLSERRACGLMGLGRSTYRSVPRRVDHALLRERLRALADRWARYGYRRLHLWLRREGWLVNHKRVYRLYRLDGLALRRRTRKRAAGLRVPPQPAPTRPNERWSMDFMTDALCSGRRFRLLVVLDDRTRECLAIEVDTSLPGERVVAVLERLVAERGTPAVIVIDNGPEFAGKTLDQWAYRRGIKLHFIAPGKPAQNAYIESFNGKFRDECLNAHWFAGLADARQVIAAWRQEYNQVRPHSALRDATPEEFARQEAMLRELLDPQVAVTL
jgi:putative transposase